jgi:ABC-2 type transport system permease protein
MLNTGKSESSLIESELGKLYAIWLREFKVFLREKSRLIASTFTPLLWLFVVGAGFGSMADNLDTINFAGGNSSGISGIDYQKFIFPGIVGMSVIFSSVFFGSYVIWDRKFDFLKSVMVAPINRTTIFVGKAFGGMTNSLLQTAILLVIGLLIGVNYNTISILSIIAIILLLSFALTSLGLILGSFIESLEGFQLIVSFVVFPLYFLSGALFPLKNLPFWLSILTTLDPATYGVDALRSAMLGITGKYPFGTDIAILFLSVISIGVVGIFSFRRMKAI